jgi:poly(A) polymerase Pap1
LEPLTDASQADLLKPIGAWQPVRLNPDERTGDEGDAMPVISSLFPEQNTAHNVNRHTLQIIQKEMRRGW